MSPARVCFTIFLGVTCRTLDSQVWEDLQAFFRPAVMPQFSPRWCGWLRKVRCSLARLRALTTYAGRRLGEIIRAAATGPALGVLMNRNSAGRRSGPVAVVPQLTGQPLHPRGFRPHCHGATSLKGQLQCSYDVSPDVAGAPGARLTDPLPRQHHRGAAVCKRVIFLKSPGCEVQEGRLPVSRRRHGPASVSLLESRTLVGSRVGHV